MKKVLFAIGTRPEAVKLAPVIMALRREAPKLTSVVVLTGQHPDMARDALEVFGLVPDIQLDVLQGTADLGVMVSRVVEAVGGLIDSHQPQAVIVQGDTLSAFSSGLAAALRRVPVAHVEAGLRTGCLDDPFPEELARRQLAQLSRWNFAPTREAEMNLLREGVRPESIDRVGNTVVDALRIVRQGIETDARKCPNDTSESWTLLVTAHRRENWGPGLNRICEAMKRLTTLCPELRVVFSVHPNPSVRSVVHSQLAGVRGVSLVDAPPYGEWVRMLLACDCILTDSGGLQEEGTALGRPVLVMRAATERPEALRAGSATMVGTEVDSIVSSVRMLMTDRETYAYMATHRDVFGDGFAAERIVARIVVDLRHAGQGPGGTSRHEQAVAVGI